MRDVTFSIHHFTYRPEFIEAGAVYHYMKSNIDGSYPARIFIYIKDNDHLEVLKFEEHGMDAALVKAHMDWETFSSDQLKSWVLTPNGEYTITWQERKDIVRVGHYSVHIYNFDFISLNYILRYWKDPEGEVRIGILQPNFDPNPETMMKYEGTVLIKYVRNEVRNGQSCRTYIIGGEGLKNHNGVMWVNTEKRIIQEIKIPIPDNPDWESFKFRFISSEHMDPRQWTEFTEDETHKLKTI